MKKLSSLALVCAAVAVLPNAPAYAITAVEQLAAYTARSGAPAQPARGQQLFTSKHGKDWSCSSCHSATPTVEGKHASTAKAIGPLAPAFNPDRFGYGERSMPIHAIYATVAPASFGMST